MIPSHYSTNNQGTKDSKPLYSIEEERNSSLSPHLSSIQDSPSKDGPPPLKSTIKQEDLSKFEGSNSILNSVIDNDISLLTPLKAPKSYGTYSKQQQEDVIAFIKDGHSLRTAEKVFGIPKSTMHCWLKKLHVKSELSTMKVENTYSDLKVETGLAFNHDAKYSSDESEMKGKPWRDRRNPQSVRKTSPSTSPIVIESSDLIRFLQTSEGVEIVAKAFNVTVNDFLNFVSTSNNKSVDSSVKGLLMSTAQTSKTAESFGVIQSSPKKTLEVRDVKPSNQEVSPNSARKRNLHNDFFSFDTALYPGIAVLQKKKIKVEQNTDDKNNVMNSNNSDTHDNPSNKIINRGRKKSPDKFFDLTTIKTDIDNISIDKCNTTTPANSSNINNSNSVSSTNNSNQRTVVTCSSSLLASLLTQDQNLGVGSGKKLVLTTKQHLATNRVNSNAQSELPNTFVTSRPVLATSPHSTTLTNSSARSITTNNTDTMKHERPPDFPFDYPKIPNPVSIKAERLDSEIHLPCGTSPSSSGGSGTNNNFVRMSPIVPSITKPVVTSNNSAARNLNEINRTQSERELMAMVDGDNVSADELCAEFKETLELSKWVDNENWYMEQYLQHFQVSPCLTSPESSLPDAPDDSDGEDTEDNAGLIFAVDKDKEKKKNSSSPLHQQKHLDASRLTSPVSVTIFEHGVKETTGEVWSTLSSPSSGSCLSTSPHTRDGLLTSPRLYDGLLYSPQFTQTSPGIPLLDTGMDPNLIQPNYHSNNSSVIN